MISKTPQPPYYAVIFTSIRTEGDNGYSDMADRMMELVGNADGFLGSESARNDLGITVSYWKDLESIRKWKADAAHQEAQNKGREHWYSDYRVRIAKVEREYGLD